MAFPQERMKILEFFIFSIGLALLIFLLNIKDEQIFVYLKITALMALLMAALLQFYIFQSSAKNNHKTKGDFIEYANEQSPSKKNFILNSIIYGLIALLLIRIEALRGSSNEFWLNLYAFFVIYFLLALFSAFSRHNS